MITKAGIRLPDISPPASFATNQLATKRPSRHQGKSTRHQAQKKNASTVCRGELAAETHFFYLSVQMDNALFRKIKFSLVV